MIKMYSKLNRKSPFIYTATWWSSTLESGKLVKRSRFKIIHNRTDDRKLNRLRLGHTNFKADLAHKKIIENPTCNGELNQETPLHVLFHCKLYDTQWESLINSIQLMYVQKQVPYHLWSIDFDILVGFNHQHSLEVRNHIAEAISTFLWSISTITSSIWPGTLPHPLHCEEYCVINSYL